MVQGNVPMPRRRHCHVIIPHVQEASSIGNYLHFTYVISETLAMSHLDSLCMKAGHEVIQ